MSEPVIDEAMVEFHEAIVDALDDFIVSSVEIGEQEFGLDSSDAFSMIASRMMYIVIRGVIKGNVSKESFLKTMEEVYDVTKLTLAEPEGGLQ
jgi:hypothetical protein